MKSQIVLIGEDFKVTPPFFEPLRDAVEDIPPQYRINQREVMLNVLWKLCMGCGLACATLACICSDVSLAFSQHPVSHGVIQDILISEGANPVRLPIIPELSLFRYYSGSTYIYNQEVNGHFVDSKALRLFRVGAEQDKMDTVVFVLPGTVVCSNRFPLLDFEIDSSYAAFVFESQFLLVYEHVRGSWHLLSSTALNHVYTRLRLLGTACYLSLAEFQANNDLLKSWLVKYNIQTGKIETEKQISTPQGVAFTSFRPRSNVSFGKSIIAVSDLTKYRILLYDTSFQLIDSIERIPLDWKPANSSNEDIERLFEQRVSTVIWLNTFSHIEDSSSLIKRIDFMDDSTLLVSWYTGNKNASGILNHQRGSKYDVWRKREGWVLVHSALTDNNPDSSSVYGSFGDIPVSLDYRSDQSRILTFTRLDPRSKVGSSFRDKFHEADEAAVDHDIVYWVLRYKYSDFK